MKVELIAPCGMNCNVCSNYLALENDTKAKGVKLPYCKGCRPRNKKCSFVKKKREKLLYNKVEFSYECNKFPSQLVTKLTKSYEKHQMNMVDNLRYTKEHGLAKFLETEKNVTNGFMPYFKPDFVKRDLIYPFILTIPHGFRNKNEFPNSPTSSQQTYAPRALHS